MSDAAEPVMVAGACGHGRVICAGQAFGFSLATVRNPEDEEAYWPKERILLVRMVRWAANR